MPRKPLTAEQREHRRLFMQEYNKKHGAAITARRFANLSEEGKRAKYLQAKTATMLKRYGLTPESRQDLLESQGGKCKLCCREVCFKGSGFSGTTAHVDHCHDTGKVRGILCGGCNTALGRLGDSIDSIRKVLEYLERGSK